MAGMISESETLDRSNLIDVDSCPICSSASFAVVGSRKSIHPRPVLIFQIRRCYGCNHWFTSPAPTQAYLSQLYSQGSLSVLGKGWEENTARSFNDATHPNVDSSSGNWVVQDATALAPERYLEIGPGDGSMLHAFKAMGWECFAVEPGSWARDKANFYRDIADLPAAATFKVIVANDVLEHMTEPAAGFSLCARKLARGGRFYCSFPNAESFRAQHGKTNWRMVRPVGHLHYFSKKSIGKLLADNGLQALRIDNYDKLSAGAVKTIFDRLSQLDFRKAAGALRNTINSTLSTLIEEYHSGDQWRVIATRD
jgi:SAM-dependent methyltransferase